VVVGSFEIFFFFCALRRDGRSCGFPLVSRKQGDQIGRIFAQWFDYLLLAVPWKLQKYPTYLGYCIYVMDKFKHTFWQNGLGYNLGDFFANSSGHPGRKSGRNIACQKNVLNSLLRHQQDHSASNGRPCFNQSNRQAIRFSRLLAGS
jgi:hypothetical protein